MTIIGREDEIQTLRYCYESDRSEFVAIYGRRRVGKTYLIKELFEDKFTFYSTGILNESKEEQLKAWNKEIQRSGGSGIPSANDWIEAFENLNILIENSPAGKKVIFLDEVPWMATRNSNFLAGLDYFWNRWASSRKDVLLIICGSAASWINDKILKNRGGLHNRLTRQIYLQPFTLHECEQYFNSRGIPLTRYQMAEVYMIFGGIPYYLSLMEPQYSLYQNVDRMYFTEDSELGDEFTSLYSSLYSNSENYICVIEALAKKGIGLTRADIINETNITDGGGLTKILSDLKLSGFIREYKAYGRKKKDSLYQLVDFFSLFDIRFRDRRNEFSDDYWLRFSTTSAHSVWRGFSFEKLCLMHLPQIRKKLGISGVLTAAFSWHGEIDGKRAQIDLVIDRNDGVINLCEIKCCSDVYVIDKAQSELMRHKRGVFTYSTRTRKSAQTTMITTFGLQRNMYSDELHSQVVLDDLFER